MINYIYGQKHENLLIFKLFSTFQRDMHDIDYVILWEKNPFN